MFVDREHIFQRQRLEIEAIAGVVIRRDSLRVAVHHDGFIPVIVQSEGRMATAIVELDPLADAIWPAAKNDDLLLLRRCGLVFFLIRGVQIRRVALELGCAGVHALVHWRKPVLLAQMPDFFLRAFSIQPPYAGKPSIRESHALGVAQHVRGYRPHGMLFQLKLHVVYLFKLIEKPGIDRGHLRNVLNRVSLAQRITYVRETLGMRCDETLRKNLRLDFF